MCSGKERVKEAEEVNKQCSGRERIKEAEEVNKQCFGRESSGGRGNK